MSTGSTGERVVFLFARGLGWAFLFALARYLHARHPGLLHQRNGQVDTPEEPTAIDHSIFNPGHTGAEVEGPYITIAYPSWVPQVTVLVQVTGYLSWSSVPDINPKTRPNDRPGDPNTGYGKTRLPVFPGGPGAAFAPEKLRSKGEGGEAKRGHGHDDDMDSVDASRSVGFTSLWGGFLWVVL